MHATCWGHTAVWVQMTSRPALLLQAGLEAASVLLRLCASETCPQAFLSEAALETVCALVASVTNANLLAFFDAAVRHEMRPDLHGTPLRIRYVQRPCHASAAVLVHVRCV